MNLKPVFEALVEIKATSGRKAKCMLFEQALMNVEYFRKTVHYALHPFWQYNMQEIQHTPLYCTEGNIFEFLSEKAKKRGATQADREILSSFSSANSQTVEVVNRILQKDLKCGIAIKTAKKYFPDEDLPLHQVMKCEYELDTLDKFIVDCGGTQNIINSLKYDGVRCWAIVDLSTAEVKYISTGGKPYPNFAIFDDSMRVFAKTYCDIVGLPYGIVTIDGEMISADKSFQTGMTQFRRLKDVDPSIFRFRIFDLPDLLCTQIERYIVMTKIFNMVSLPNVDILEHESIAGWDDKKIVAELEKVSDAGEEGLVLKNTNGMYECRYSKQWCKLKKVYPIDVKVLGWEPGKKGTRLENTIGKLLVDYNGVTVRVGGLKDSHRKDCLEELPEMIEILHNGETKDGSLRHPRFKRVRDDK